MGGEKQRNSSNNFIYPLIFIMGKPGIKCHYVYKVYTYFKQKCNIVLLKLAFKTCYSIAALHTNNPKSVMQNNCFAVLLCSYKNRINCATDKDVNYTAWQT